MKYDPASAGRPVKQHTMPLSIFTEPTRNWFRSAFAAPTEAQAQAWPVIAAGNNALITAPTGSGKTLAAFLWGIDRLAASPSPSGRRRTRLVYVSPLKALSYDVERNLKAPLRGIGTDLAVALRTGDTPQRERMAMRRNPPDILITTPESLYLMLTSGAREMLGDVEWVVVDEIHSVAGSKRGAHLALTLERLERLVDKPIQRIGLSATQRPLEEVAKFLVGSERSCEIVDAGVRKKLDLKIHVPVETQTEPGGEVELDPLEGGESTRGSIWSAIYPALLDLIQEHKTTIVFVNSRRAAERLALRINEVAGRDVARAHHGSLARLERTAVEEQLKAGAIPCIVATSSLELGIDMGAVDCVVQVESPKSVTAGLQRIGRSGHGVNETAKGRIFPKFRADLVECAVVAKRMRSGEVETTVVPKNALDVLAQQIVAITAMETLSVVELHTLVTRTYNYGDLSRRQLENVLDMLDGRYPSEQFSELKARIVWDRVAGTVRAREGAGRLAIVGGGTIPDRGLYTVNLPDGRRIGELDEEMVYEARPGQAFLLGSTSWRIEEIQRDRVVVTPAPGIPGAVPFWRGEGLGRPSELGEAIGKFVRKAAEQPVSQLETEYDLDPRAASDLVEYLREQEAKTGVLPSDKTVVVERFRDEIGDWRLCVLTPFGGRVHAAWSLAIKSRIRDRLGIDADAIWSDDGIAIHLPDADDPPAADLVILSSAEVEESIVQELGSSALFGARFRENASRALLIPRAYPGKRTPLWQQRLKAQSLLETTRRFSDFPIVLETYRECLRDVLDVDALVGLLRLIETREISVVEVETDTASPFASSLLFDFVATYMYEGDQPSAERRAAALSLDRDLLRELVGQEEMRELLDANALEGVEADLQLLSHDRLAFSRDDMQDRLRRLGDLTTDEAKARVRKGVDAAYLLRELERERRAVRVRIFGEERWIAADDAGLYRDALGVPPPAGLPEAFLDDRPDALVRLAARYARTHGPFTEGEFADRYGVRVDEALRELEGSGTLVHGEMRPGGSTPEWCDSDVLKRLRRASLAVLRKEIEAVDASAFALFMPAWQGIDRRGSQGAGPDRLREVLVPLQGVALTPRVWEQDVLPRRIGAYSPSWLDELTTSGEIVWVGAGSHGRDTGRVAIYFREDLALLGPPDRRGEPVEAEEGVWVRDRLQEGACFFEDLVGESDMDAESVATALWSLVWAGEVTNDAFAPLRAKRLTIARSVRPRPTGERRFYARRARSQKRLYGRWSLVEPLLAGAPPPGAKRRALAEILLERYGILTREQVLAEGVKGGFSAIYDQLLVLETLGVARRGYFVEGLGGAQFAVPGAVERLRSLRDVDTAPSIVLAATDPAQPFGGALPWPRLPKGVKRRPARVAGAYVVLVGADPVIYVERGGRALVTLVDPGDGRIDAAFKALVESVSRGHLSKLALEKIDGAPAIESSHAVRLVELGFGRGPRRLTLSAR